MKAKKTEKKSQSVANAPAPKANSLSSRAVLIRLSAGQFIGSPKDKSLGREIESAHDTAEKKISVRKKIMQGKELSACGAALQQVRNLHASLSLPWIEGGIGIIPSREIIRVKTEIEAKIRDFETKADLFVASYDSLLTRDALPAPDGLGSAFNRADYPSKSELRGKFYARVELLPVPSDFRVEGIDQGVQDTIAQAIAKETESRLRDAKRETLARVEAEVRHLCDRLNTAKDKAKFHGSALSNVSQACDAAGALNIDDDPAIAATLEIVKSLIAPLSADTIRENESAKETAKETASKALAEISQVMAGFMA